MSLQSRRRLLPVALFSTLIVWVASAPALEDDQYQPMYIEADAAELDDKQSTSLYIGNVDVTQGSMHILADEVLVHHKQDRRAQKIIAIGNPVRYRQRVEDDPDEVIGRALRMEYEADREELVLIDEAVLTQGEDRFASDRIVYNRITDRVTAGTSAQGSERVKIRIEPESATARDSGGESATASPLSGSEAGP